jgi:hypothetical protein
MDLGSLEKKSHDVERFGMLYDLPADGTLSLSPPPELGERLDGVHGCSGEADDGRDPSGTENVLPSFRFQT